MRSVAGVVIALLPGAAAAAESVIASPLVVRNLSPVVNLYGLPVARGGLLASGATEWSVTVEHSNNFSAEDGDPVAASFDGSTTVTRLDLRGALGTRWEWGVAAPYVHHSGGFTDGFIEGWHDLFGLPDASRDAVARNRLQYRIAADGADVVAVTESRGHVGDLSGHVGYRLLATPGRQAVVRGSLKLPTGRVRDLSGSGATDASLAVELVEQRLLEGLGTTLTLMAGVTRLGAGDLLRDDQQRVVLSGHLGLHYPLTDRLILRGQLDGHGDIVESGNELVAARALLGTLGGTLLLGDASRLDVAVVEELTPPRAPDVVFLLRLSMRL